MRIKENNTKNEKNEYAPYVYSIPYLNEYRYMYYLKKKIDK